MKQIFTMLMLLQFFSNTNAQSDSEPTKIKDFIKKDKGKYGIWIKDNKEFVIAPEYDKITGVSFTKNATDEINHCFYKCRKGETFDLLFYNEKKKSPTNFYIIVKNINEFSIPPFLVETNKYGFYRKADKWGWFLTADELKKDGKKVLVENHLQPATFDSEPQILPSHADDFSKVYDKFLVNADSAGMIGLYTLTGQPLIKHGPFFRFKCVENKGINYIEITGQNKMKGYAINNQIVPPQYEFFVLETMNLFPAGSKVLFQCYTPSREVELRDGVKLLSKEEVAALELSSKKLKDAKYAAEESRNKPEITPFEVVKFVRSGSAKDLLAYVQSFGMNYTNTTKNGTVEYIATGAFEVGPETIVDSQKDGVTVTFKFRDSAHRRMYMEKLKEEGFEGIELSQASARVRKDGVDIWFIIGEMSQQTWVISKTSP